MSRIEEALRRSGNAPSDWSEAQEAQFGHGASEHLIQYSREREQTVEAALPRVVNLDAATGVATHGVDDVRHPRVPPSFDSPASQRLVVSREVPPATVEQYGKLAAALFHAQAEHGIKSVMVSSALPREGKTITTANLALTLSESYRQRVLLVDTDLRGAAVHLLFGLSISPGLGDFLDGENPEIPIVRLSETLAVLPAGRSADNPLAGLVSPRMKLLLERATDQFDWVLLDTPPLGLLSDANLLARLTDGVVFVIGAGLSPYATVHRAISTIGPERVLGVVLNRAAASSVPENSYYGTYAPGGRVSAGR